MDRPTRLERHLTIIETAAEGGNFSVKLNLFPSERKRLRKMGFIIIPSGESLKTSQPCQVVWTQTPALSLPGLSLWKYIYISSDRMPDSLFFSDVCFLTALRKNLNNPHMQEFGTAYNNLYNSIFA